jgi:hypothetical protein
LNTPRQSPLIAQLAVIALLLGSLPITATPVIVQRDRTPAFALDVCRPLPAFEVGAASCMLPAFAACSFACMIEDCGPAVESILPLIGRTTEAPDPPPPKTLA